MDALETTTSSIIDLLANTSDFLSTSTPKATTILPLEQCKELGIDLPGDASVHNNSAFSHIRCLEHAPTFSQSGMIRVIVLSAMAVVSLLGNIATMWNIQKNRKSKRVTRHTWSAIYSLIFHLSISDVLVTGFCIIGEAGWTYTVEWRAGEYACKLFKMFQMFSLYLSTNVMVLIGIDRWVAVKYPMKSLNTSRRCHRFLVIAYSISFLLSLPQYLIFRVAKGPFYEDFYQCVTHGFYSANWQEQLYTTFTLIFMFIIPLVILTGTYLSTFRTIAKSERIFRLEAPVEKCYRRTDSNRQRLIHKAKMKSLRISVVIVFAFIICWTPYYVMMIIFMFLNPDRRLSEDLQQGIFFFGMSNSLMNPLIYGAFQLWPNRKPFCHQRYVLLEGSTVLRRTLSTNMNQLAVNGHSPQLKTFNGSNHHKHNHEPLLAKTHSQGHDPPLNQTPSPPMTQRHSVEEISLMSLEKDLRSLDENVNQVNNAVNNKIKNGTTANRKNIIAASLLRLKILKFRQKNPTTL
ncbi:gonadotropin-releasing hormone receptor [Culicoides brevitarsis]|uniref:gonadotropin-releasing hormone receptor n=1 Tax=Culicoides brevitarsis TaxID=469753 RepID=UPI00307CC092